MRNAGVLRSKTLQKVSWSFTNSFVSSLHDDSSHSHEAVLHLLSCGRNGSDAQICVLKSCLWAATCNWLLIGRFMCWSMYNMFLYIYTHIHAYYFRVTFVITELYDYTHLDTLIYHHNSINIGHVHCRIIRYWQFQWLQSVFVMWLFGNHWLWCYQNH